MRWLFVLLALAALAAGVMVIGPNIVEGVRQPPAPGAPPPPPVKVNVAGVPLSVPRDLVRFDNQKNDGDVPRLDLAFQWPSLEGRGEVRGTPENLSGLIFLSLVPKDESLPPTHRLGGIYQKFLNTEILSGPGGLARKTFRRDTGYDDEELMYDPSRPGGYFVRCGPPAGSAPASCLREVRIGEKIDVVYRFARARLEDWKDIESSVFALLGAIGAPESPRE